MVGHSTGRAKGAVPGDTKLGLILAAEKAFSIYGLSGTTYRHIREEAGQKNESVVHYYFGSKEGVIKAILELRTGPINKARLAMLKTMRRENQGGVLSTEQIMRCCFMPFANHLFSNGAVGYYARFLAKVGNSRRFWTQYKGNHDESLIECLDELKKTRPHIPPGIINQRFIACMFVFVPAIAVMEEKKCENLDLFRSEEAGVQLEELVTASIAIMDAGLSAGLVNRIGRARKEGVTEDYRAVLRGAVS